MSKKQPEPCTVCNGQNYQCHHCDGMGEEPRKIDHYAACKCILSQYCDGKCNPVFADQLSAAATLAEQPTPASTGREKTYQVWQFGVGGWRDTTRQKYEDTHPGYRQIVNAPVAARELDVEAEFEAWFEKWRVSAWRPLPSDIAAGKLQPSVHWNTTAKGSMRIAYFAARSAAQSTAPSNSPEFGGIATVSTEQAGDAQKEEKAARDAAKLAWECALSDAAFYVAGHCVDGDHHAEIITGMAMPKMTFRDVAPSPNNSPVGGKGEQ